MTTTLRTVSTAAVPLLIALSCFFFATTSQAAPTNSQGGISLGSTRVIYNERANGASVRVINTSAEPFLIQSWTDNYRGQGGWEKADSMPPGIFVVTPPLFRLDEGENSVMLRRAGGDLPADRESVFSLNVKALPQVAKPAAFANYVQFAFVNSIKLFWRPAGLVGSPGDAYKQLNFKRQGDHLEAFNPTPYHITIKTLKVGNVEVKDPDNRMVPPKGTQNWSLPAGTGEQVTYTTITDFGGLTSPTTATLQ